jgi:hypothetical protein
VSRFATRQALGSTALLCYGSAAMPLWPSRALVCSLALIAAPTAAQEPAAAPPAAPSVAAPTTATSAACYPACREGFTCHQGQCISLCNPPCPDGLECVEGRRCEPPAPSRSAARPYEPPPPPVKTFESRSHALFGFHLGLPGNYSLDGQDGDLASTLGFNLRADAPIGRYVLLGPMLQMGSWAPDVTPEPSHSYYVDLDLVLRLRVPITTSTLNYQLWVGMPVGITVDIWGPDEPQAGLGLGWNIGVLLGGAVHFSSSLGLFAEVGWLQHKLSHPVDGAADLDFKLQQACLNLGIIVRN